MGGYWSEVERGAGREFGRRHYRAVAAWKIGRVLAGPVAVALALGLLAYTAVRYGWPALRHGAPVAWHWSANLVPGLIVAGICLVLVPAGVVAWRRWGWEVEVRAPWLTGRVVSVLGAVAMVALTATVAWPR
jgi:hypothetical protein